MIQHFRLLKCRKAKVSAKIKKPKIFFLFGVFSYFVRVNGRIDRALSQLKFTKNE